MEAIETGAPSSVDSTQGEDESDSQFECEFLDEVATTSTLQTASASSPGLSNETHSPPARKRGRPRKESFSASKESEVVKLSPYNLLVVQLLQKKASFTEDTRLDKHRSMVPLGSTVITYAREMALKMARTWSNVGVLNAPSRASLEEVEQLRVLYALSLGCLQPRKGGARHTLDDVCNAVGLQNVAKPNVALSAPRIDAVRSVACGLYAQTCDAFEATERAWREAYAHFYTAGSEGWPKVHRVPLVDLAKQDAVSHAVALLAMLCAWGTVCNGADALAHWRECASLDVATVRHLRKTQAAVNWKDYMPRYKPTGSGLLAPETPCSPSEAALNTRLSASTQGKSTALHVVRTTYYKVWTNSVGCLLRAFQDADAIDGVLLTKFVLRHTHTMLAIMDGLQTPASRSWMMSAVSNDVCKTPPVIGCPRIELLNVINILPQASHGQNVTPVCGEGLAARSLCTTAVNKTSDATLSHECVPIPNGVFVCRYVALVSGWSHMKRSPALRAVNFSSSLMQTIEGCCKDLSAQNDMDADHSQMHAFGSKFLNGCRLLSVLCDEDSAARKRIRLRELQPSYAGPRDRVPTVARVRAIQLGSIEKTQLRRQYTMTMETNEQWMREIAQSWHTTLAALRGLPTNPESITMAHLQHKHVGTSEAFAYAQQVRFEAALLWMVGDCMRRNHTMHMPMYSLLFPLSVS